MADNLGKNVGFHIGKFNNFRSYSRALTASEIQMLYQAKQ